MKNAEKGLTKFETVSAIEKRINGIKKGIVALTDIRPGSLSQQFNVCGNPTCRCKNPTNPQRHGPYFNLSYTYRGKQTSEYIPKEYVRQTKRGMSNYTKLKILIDEWIELSMKKTKIEIKLMRMKTGKTRHS